MEVTYVGHAAIHLRGSDGTTILMDPWLVDPSYCNAWFHYPPLVHSLAYGHMLAFVLVSLLTWYFYSVHADEAGNPPLFFLSPAYWCPLRDAGEFRKSLWVFLFM